MEEGKVLKISEPIIVADGMSRANLYALVRIGENGLAGEIIDKYGDCAKIRVFGGAKGLSYGDKVISNDEPLSAELGPGLLATVYDGVQRPLNLINMSSLDRERIWHFKPMHVFGDSVKEGDLYGTVEETGGIVHKIMVPVGKRGLIVELYEGYFRVTDRIGKIKLPDGTIEEITLMQKWPVRIPRPYAKRLLPTDVLASGQMAIDKAFPISKGGTVCVSGSLETGKTVLLQEIVKHSDADIVVYIGCGANKRQINTFVGELKGLKDIKTGRPIIERTVIVASTADKPLAESEVSIYTGMTIAEYYRDMGYSVAVIADSMSRFADAFSEIAGRLEEVPDKESCAVVLCGRIEKFYERAGKVICLGKEGRQGDVSIIGACDGDATEPAAQATRRASKVFLELDKSLAYYRHFPAINLRTSYSLYDKAKDLKI